MSVAKRYVQLYDNYDKAFVDQVRTLKYWGTDDAGEEFCAPLPVVFATPERAFAQIRSQIARRRGRSTPEDAQIQTIPLPFASLSRTSEQMNMDRWVTADWHRAGYDSKTRRYARLQKPASWDLTYDLDIWTRNLFTLNDFTTQIVAWLTGDWFTFRVDHPAPVRWRNITVHMKGMTDNSKLDPANEEERKLRRTFTFVVEGWVMGPVRSVGLVDSVHTHVIDDYKDPAVELEEWVDTVPLPEDKDPNEVNA